MTQGCVVRWGKELGSILMADTKDAKQAIRMLFRTAHTGASRVGEPTLRYDRGIREAVFSFQIGNAFGCPPGSHLRSL